MIYSVSSTYWPVSPVSPISPVSSVSPVSPVSSCNPIGLYCTSKCYHKNVSHLINKDNVNYIKNAVVCTNNENKIYFFDIHGNLIEKQVCLIKPSTREMTDLLDHNVHIENAFRYEFNRSAYYVTKERSKGIATETSYNINWNLISNTGNILFTSSVKIISKVEKLKFYTILDNCMDPNKNENFLKPCCIRILKNTYGDYEVKYYGLNNRFLLSNTFPYKITLKKDLQTILDDKKINKVWCNENLENIKKRSSKLKKNDCVIL